MANKQLSDVGFRQFSEAGPPDTSTGEILEALGKGVVDVTTQVSKNQLRSEVQAERDKF